MTINEYRKFYLASQDWGAPWEPRECIYLDTIYAEPTGQKLFKVIIKPALQKDLCDCDDLVNIVLLGILDDTWTLNDIGRFGFMVDIYVPKDKKVVKKINAKDLIRIGVGTLHADRAAAED